ncbi:uncharacterized protein CTRU02_210921 [Colletotrichum truncatum]|uniref:Uncharacterized protein n=1 Tax=Colletotrichum truncatum TaxID=5467 RepID=A0ACC3YQI3_COLTU|nr:uncharacterized protein CTRU02_03593 [Colletotrichum truncatum]KAF6796615.1 hypothetical protein CTRU02_03593 [Colletotrichum truncatum]
MTSNQSQPPSTLLGTLNEVCILTPHLYKTLDNLTRLGMGPFRVFKFDSSTVPKQELHGKTGSDLFEVLVAFAQSPDADQPVFEII